MPPQTRNVICKIMNQKAIKIYFYPLLVITLSILPWWAFSKYLLKFNFISFLASSTNTSYTAALIYCLVLVSIFYTGWVFVNMWIENAKSQDEREKRIESFFINYGKSFIGIVVIQFVIVTLLFTLIA